MRFTLYPCVKFSTTDTCGMFRTETSHGKAIIRQEQEDACSGRWKGRRKLKGSSVAEAGELTLGPGWLVGQERHRSI